MKVETITEKLLFNTVRLVVDKEPDAAVATGFIFVRDDEDAPTNIPLLVTNRHVLDDSRGVQLEFARSDGKGGWRPGARIVYSINFATPDVWFSHPNPDVDVALLPLAEVFEDAEREHGEGPFHSVIRDEQFALDDEMSNLDAVEDVLFVGYPSGIADPVNHVPVVRRAITATPPALDYGGLPAFLIDGSVFPGSSGSPVFLVDRGSWRPSEGGLAVGSRFFFLGVVAKAYLRPVKGTVRLITTSDGTSTHDEAIDLGIVYKASAVRETIQAFLEHKGAA